MNRVLLSSIVCGWVSPMLATVSWGLPPDRSYNPYPNSIAATASIDRAPQKAAKPQFEPKPHQTAPRPIQSGDFDSLKPDRLAQIVSVSELSDVQPGDWAYQALQSLIERYACVKGYPDGRFQGDRVLTRYEFAAGLNACLDAIALINSSPPEVSPEEIDTVRRLQGEFAAELATLRGRVDVLEARTAELEARQFSPTAILGGESIFAFSGGTGGEPGEGNANFTFTHLTRLGIVSSFTGKDRLRLELTSSNFGERGFANPEAFNTDMALLSLQSDTDNDLRLDKLEYRFAALGDRVVFTLRPVGFSLSNVLTANSPYFDAGRGALSRFGEASPIFKIGSLDAGVGFDWLMTDTVRLQVAYGTRDTSDAEGGGGLFAADRSAAGVQLLLKPTADILAGVAYVYAYSSNGRLDVFSGSFRADTASFLDAPAQIQGITGTLQWRLAKNLTVNTWGGWTFTDAIDSQISATTTTYLVGLGYSDPFGRKGDLLAFLFGQPPKLVSGTDLPLGEDPDTSLHFELFYRLGVSDRISITPGFFLVTNPEHDRNNDNLFIGAIRTTFRF